MSVRLILADDHPLVLDGLEQLFRLERDFQVVARCRDGNETLRAVRLHRPDLLVLDIKMPGLDGLSVLRAVRDEGLPTETVLLTAALDDDQLVEAVRLGVRGVVLKESAPRVIISALREVRSGGSWLEGRAVSRALQKLVRREKTARDADRVLTPREIEIVRMVGSGARNREIAARLFITEGTVKIHFHNIYEKLAINSRVELALWARDQGLA
ncbi:MAG TPA: response regulator transcription factor [Thermoanaerobaculia bacterium]|nr:response regulator transcription factor [Thermoanaerobaculia bacterium]